MKIGIIGSGVVAQTLGYKLIGLGHDVILGHPRSEQAGRQEDVRRDVAGMEIADRGSGQGRDVQGGGRSRRAADQRHLGQVSLEALKLAAADKVGAKVLLDVANELDFSKGRPPAVLASQERCLAEKLQAAFPNLKVVKSLNTISAPVMVDPQGARRR